MEIILKALQVATEAHKEQKRKIDQTPYIAHPAAVAMILQNQRQNIELVIAGILHDILEDTKVDKTFIKNTFGHNVLELVEKVTEDKSIKDWKERKQKYINTINSSTSDVMLLSAADKFHNLFTIFEDSKILEDKLWNHFKAGKQEQFWFYNELCKIYERNEILREYDLIHDIRKLINQIFEEKENPTTGSTVCHEKAP